MTVTCTCAKIQYPLKCVKTDPLWCMWWNEIIFDITETWNTCYSFVLTYVRAYFTSLLDKKQIICK